MERVVFFRYGPAPPKCWGSSNSSRHQTGESKQVGTCGAWCACVTPSLWTLQYLCASQRPDMQWHRKCPYDFEVTKDGRLIIDGEDFGNKDAALAQGNAISRLVRLWHEVAKGSGQTIAIN